LDRDVGGSRGDLHHCGFMNNVDELNGEGSVGGGSGVVLLGTILGSDPRRCIGTRRGFVAAVLGAAILVP
jgi:hypothetical protein